MRGCEQRLETGVHVPYLIRGRLCGVPHKVFVHFLCEGAVCGLYVIVCFQLGCMTVDLNMYIYIYNYTCTVYTVHVWS